MHIDIMAGTTIQEAAERAQALTILTEGEVSFDFNDISLIATPETNVEALVAQYETEAEARAEAYRQTPKYKLYQKKLAAKQKQYQQRTDTLIAHLPIITTDDAALAQWVADFYEASDLIGVTFDAQSIIAILGDAGFTTDDVTQAEEAVRTNGHLYVRWLMANVMKCLGEWGHLPPIAAHFGEEYARSFLSDGTQMATTTEGVILS